ncbi:prepilin-type N-terminal cleavage/methylation domain-containing protein [Sporosarcina jiandibaonis]|uniref:prepilin-type N-terminal cleavage/methylation domain-containing protein n=1 Tax=Sporosarcina jiandibaonis TaxID=2715535 RepID=UPI002483414E|nr:prepilin-type N-terminal cleavage/methylation domain-containing protein [Sporosarcina jiandibaonis]
MFKSMKKQLNNEKGLTLIELLAVIVILAIIAAIAVPAIGNIINNSKDKAILAEASNILAGAKIAAVDNACNPEATPTTCTMANLGEYVEGVTQKGSTTLAYSASRAPSGEWSIIYSNFDALNDKRGLTGTASVDETVLNGLLNP